MTIEAFMRDLGQRLGRGPAAEDRLQEIRQHLEDTVTELQQADPSLSREMASSQALQRFGGVSDYAAPLSALDRVLNFVPAFVPKGAAQQRRLVVVGIVVLLLAGIAATALATHEGRNEHALLHREVKLTQFSGPMNETFVVPQGIATLRFTLRSEHEHDGAGCINITLVSPAGGHLLSAGASCARIESEIPASPGTWSIQLTLTDFTGTLEMEIHPIEAHE